MPRASFLISALAQKSRLFQGGFFYFHCLMASIPFIPQDVPPHRVDVHLSPVDVLHLSANSLRERFRVPPMWEPELKGDRLVNTHPSAEAAVLIPLVQRDDELKVLLTQRTAHLTHHPGQVSFPGGRAEPQDANAVATALREANEEIGLLPDFVEVLGQLPAYTTATGFIVAPVVALVHPGFVLKADANEVAHVFEVPLSFLMNPANHRWHSIDVGEAAREFLSLLWLDVGESGDVRHHLVWGATAAMLRNLYRFLLA